MKKGFDYLERQLNPLFSPVYLFTCFMVKLSSPGPIIYKQERIGQFGIPFNIYKFRSKCIDAEKTDLNFMKQTAE